MKRRTKWMAALVTAIVACTATSALAVSVTLNGITFAEETPGFEITGGSGTGTLADPFVIQETVTGLDVTFAIRGFSASFGNQISDPNQRPGFRLKKIILNNTGSDWSFYDNELQQILGVASSEGDGLSFAQNVPAPNRPTSPDLPVVDEITDVRDFVNFSGGLIPVGATLTIEYSITDTSPNELFYLRQRPNFRPGGVPDTGSSALLLGAAAFALFALRSRIKAR